ncbi:hypothetical protein KL943_004511 [Ogataea angusta]|nr:hypothetical protein KL943_004511 [Ogataea angusta]
MSDFATKLTTVVHDDDQMDVEAAELPPHLAHMGEAEQPAPSASPERVSTEPEEHDPNELRPGSLLLSGVDELDTRAIKLYIDSFLKPDLKFENREEYARFNYTLEWVNDKKINIVFEQPDAALEALSLLSEVSDGLSPEQERGVMEYISNDPGFNDQNVRLSIRQSYWGDRKVKGAKNYSRYYLIHGEPEPTQRRRTHRNYKGGRGGARNRGPDLITGEDTGPVDEQDGDSHRKLEVSGRWDGPRSRGAPRGPSSGRSERGRDRYRERQQPRRGARDDEEDLFPDFLKNRDRSPARMEE